MSDLAALDLSSAKIISADSLRAEGAAAERERIRLELLAEAKAEDRLLRRATLVRLPGSVLRDFARRLETS